MHLIDVDATPINPKDGTKSYAILRSSLQRDVAAAARAAGSWPEAVAAAIAATVTIAAEDPAAAHRLVLPAAGRRSDDLQAFGELVDDLAGCLRRGAPPGLGSERTSRNVVLRIARQLCLQLETRPHEPVTSIAPDLIVFALTPYVGMAAARRLADQPIETS